MTVIYSARWVLPIISPAIEYGAIAFEGSQIIAVGKRTEIVSRFPEANAKDFGEAAILPGFVNAHSHLELTAMRGLLEREENDFFAWLKKLTLARLAMTAEDLLLSATCGAIEAARAGVTCLGDASSAASQAVGALHSVGLRGIVYQESFGPDPNLAKENVAKLRDQISELRTLEGGLVRVGVSPHAPYSVSGPQLELISRLAIDEKLPVTMHAAESKAEKLFMLEGQGVFAEGLRARGIEWQAPGISTIQYLERHGVLEAGPLLAHCISVDGRDLELIKQNSASVAHCPKSNAKLGHGRAPFAEFINNGIEVGLGSDSVASNNTCDMLEEARFATLLARLDWGSGPTVREASGFDESDAMRALPGGRATAPVTAEQALFTATLGGARALGLDNQVGALADGMQADLTVVSLNGPHQGPVGDPVAALVFSSSGRDVLRTIVAGQEIYRDGWVKGVDESELGQRLLRVRRRTDSRV
ncbi:MAG TPA: amidohydrolase family protein [Pyrinomonadaceae bacterium]|nr:amidohydrolase family protein [Pyrinomonadaceae bacterium]